MYKTLRVSETDFFTKVTLHRPEDRNSINGQMIQEMHHVFDQAEKKPSRRFIVLEGENNLFCTGMDFKEQIQWSQTEQQDEDFSSDYMNLLKRFSTTPKIVISLIDGQVLAGGVGIVAASDIVLSTSRTQFGLSEALWGLLPACVTPFLIRRIGFQKAYFMTLTTQTISATEAYRIGLVDELSDNITESLRRFALRLNRIQEETIKDLKSYFRKMWIVTEEMEAEAVAEISRLTRKPQVQMNIKNFVEHRQFPWEGGVS